MDLNQDGSSQNEASRNEASYDRPFEKSIQLYEERLVTQKQRVKTGEVKISKVVVTDVSQENIPITREKVVIEIESIYSGQTRVDFGEAKVSADGTVRMGIYEEQTEVCRRIVPYQNISVRKEAVRDVVSTQQVVRKEELDVRTEGNPEVEWVALEDAEYNQAEFT